MLVSLALVALALTVAAIWAAVVSSPFALGLGLLAGGFFAVTFILSENWNPREGRFPLRNYEPRGRGEESAPPRSGRSGLKAPLREPPRYHPIPPESPIVTDHLCEGPPPIPKNKNNSCYIAASLGVLLSMRWVRDCLANIRDEQLTVRLTRLREYLASLDQGAQPNPEIIRDVVVPPNRRKCMQDAHEKVWGVVFDELSGVIGGCLRYRLESEGVDDLGREQQIVEIGRENEIRVSIRGEAPNLQDMLLREIDTNEKCVWQTKGKITHTRYVFTQPPPVLNLSIRRFGNNLRKNCAYVSVPEHLSIPADHFHPPLEAPPRYQLDGFVVHQGLSLGGGHYVGYIRTKGEWYLLNDLWPEPQVVTRDEALQAAQTAYLFYYSQIPSEPPHPLA